MFFNSVKEINRLRKEINRLLSKGMSNIYLKVTIETFSKLRFSGFKKFVTRSVFGELQLTQISLNFKTSCCNLKIRGLGAKLCVAFLLFWFWKELWHFKVKESMKNILFFISMYSVFNTLSEYTHFSNIKKHYFMRYCCLLLKLSKVFSVSLMH